MGEHPFRSDLRRSIMTSFLVAAAPDFVKRLLQLVVGVIGVIDVGALALDLAIAQATWALSLDLGIAEALGPLALDLGVAEPLGALAVDVGVAQALGALTFAIELE